MKSILISTIVSISFFTGFSLKIYCQKLSSVFLESVPQVEKKLNSKNVLERISILDVIVVNKIDYDVSQLVLPFNLTTNDYSIVLKKIFEKDLSQIDEKVVSEAFYKIAFLIEKQKIKSIIKQLVIYLPKFTPTGLQDFQRIGIQSTIIGVTKKFQSNEYISYLIPLLDSSIKYIQRKVVFTLIEIRAKEVIPTLIEMLNDKNSNQRFGALKGLVKVNATSAIPKIAKLLEDDNSDIRYWALDALIKLNAKEFSPQIWTFLKNIPPNNDKLSTDEIKRNYAIIALLKFGENQAIPLAISQVTARDLSIRLDMMERLVNENARLVIPALIDALKNEGTYFDSGTDSNIRRDIMECLGKFKADEAIPIIQSYVLGKNKRNKFLQTSAVSVLGDLSAKQAVNDIFTVFKENLPKDENDKVTNDTYHSATAALALAKIGDKKLGKA